ncbi:gastrokine-1-like [Hemicordylus capensis]|uniref:gastrokine-1-like n=1 Tax=Hemicordylus capensis TaxID=884348 RepID=UPI00230485BF|nr:gastrokine-1-like [Hemicordylus capensis]
MHACTQQRRSKSLVHCGARSLTALESAAHGQHQEEEERRQQPRGRHAGLSRTHAPHVGLRGLKHAGSKSIPRRVFYPSKPRLQRKEAGGGSPGPPLRGESPPPLRAELLHCQVLSIALLGVFLAPILASDNISEKNQGNVGGNSHQSVNIDNQKQVVNVDNNNGWHSWNTLWDYRSGYMATRILSKKACVVTRMNKQIMPDITTLPQAIREKQKDNSKGPARKDITYVVSPKRITDLSPYGKSVEAMCKGLPTYAAYEVRGKNFFYYSGSCFRANLLCLLGISFCGETVDY